MILIDLEAEQPYTLDGKYSVGILKVERFVNKEETPYKSFLDILFGSQGKSEEEIEKDLEEALKHI